MLQEIRLYYESIEQAYNCILPEVQETVKSLYKDVEVKLVKMSNNYTYYSRRVSPILFWKKPDVLMTIIENGKEFPLLLIEFSTAVFTEDHELQRFDGMLAAAKNNCIYVKISPTKKRSPYKHGGKIEFDYVKPFRLIYFKYGKPYFHFEWHCNEMDVAETDPDFLSCPKQIPELKTLLRAVTEEIISKGYSQDWIKDVCNELRKYNYFREWLSKLKSKLEENVSTLNTSRTRWIEKDPLLHVEALEIKLNRFGHAMDPERGMLAYYGTLTSNVVSKMVFSERTDAWFKDIPKEDEIKNIVRRGLEKVYDFLLCFALGSGLYVNKEFMNIIRKYRNCSKKHAIIDLTEFIRANFLKLNKALKTIFSYSKLFIIEDDSGQRRVTFTWKPFRETDAYKNYSEVTQITEREKLDEDDVTYIIVHNILRPNGFKLIAVSYPGAQGDRRILVQAGTGRRQPRKYIDIISYLPSKAIILEENKGVYNVNEIQEEIDELSLYKNSKAYINGLKDFLERFAPKAVGAPIKIGIGFWANRSFSISHIKRVDLKDLDYFVYVTKDRRSWKIWRSNNGNIFSTTSGEVELPKTFEIKRPS